MAGEREKRLQLLSRLASAAPTALFLNMCVLQPQRGQFLGCRQRQLRAEGALKAPPCFALM
jgi:hypothetical protein